MFELLHSQILKRIPLTGNEFERTKTFFIRKKVRKGQFLLHAGEACRYLAFVERGYLRQYSVDGNGEEHVVQFAVEEWWISDMYSSLTGTSATYNIDALEDSEMLAALLPHSTFAKAFTTGLSADFATPTFAGTTVDCFVAGDDEQAIPVDLNSSGMQVSILLPQAHFQQAAH